MSAVAQELLKEILPELRKEMQKLKSEILDGKLTVLTVIF